MLKLLILLAFAVVFCGKNTSTKTEIFEVNGVKFKMIGVANGTFAMGAQADDSLAVNYDSDAEPNEGLVHNVTLTKDYYIGETEVTQELWEAIMGSNPSWFQSSTDAAYTNRENYPVEQVSWEDIVGTSGGTVYTINGITYYQDGFCYKLSQLIGNGKQFRLPTEAEWEYAARSGGLRYCPCKNGDRISNGSGVAANQTKYSGSNNIDDVAWYLGIMFDGTQEVKTKQSNALGIYDMSGNVEEWCSDFANSESYSGSDELDPTGPVGGFFRVFRGGNFRSSAKYCRVSCRYGNISEIRTAWIGLRLALGSE